MTFVVGIGGTTGTVSPTAIDRGIGIEFEDDSSDSMPWWPWVLVGVGSAGCCFVLFAYQRRRNQPEDYDQVDGDDHSAFDEEE